MEMHQPRFGGSCYRWALRARKQKGFKKMYIAILYFKIEKGLSIKMSIQKHSHKTLKNFHFKSIIIIASSSFFFLL